MSLSADIRTNLLALTEGGMAAFVARLGWPAFRAQQILRWLYQQRVRAFAQMTNLTQRERAHLTACCIVGRTADVQVFASQDGTRKFVLTLADGNQV